MRDCFFCIVIFYIIITVEAGAPSQPVVDEITPDSVTLSWEKPKDDGGGRIKGYVVEMKKDGSDDWEEVTPTPVQDTTAKIPHLKEGTKAQFRVKAVNDAGPGTPSRPTGTITVEKQPEKPSIDLGALKDVTIKAGKDLKVAVPVKGHPPPTATFENDGVVVSGPRVKVEVKDDTAFLVITKSERGDSGPYVLKLRNPNGTCEGSFKVNVQGMFMP